MRSTTVRGRRAALVSFVLSLAAGPAAAANTAPVFNSTPSPVVDVGRTYEYVARATDAERDALRYELVQAPAGVALAAESGRLTWSATAAQIGSHGLTLRAVDAQGASTEQRFTLRVVQDFCAIYPIALPLTVIDGLQPGARIAQLPRGTGAGNYSWLSWTGAVDAPTLAQSLVPPGDSDRYVEPQQPSDHLLEAGDWAQGATGSMNASDVRQRLDALLNQDIVLPVWDQTRGQGSWLDYRVARFAVVRLTGYQLTGQGWLGFEYRGEARCYNAAPMAETQDVRTPEDTATVIRLRGTDADGETLSYEIVEGPSHGTLTGAGSDRTYTPAANFAGSDTLRFRVSDGREWSEPATVRIEVTPVNDLPRAEGATHATDEDTTLAFVLSGSDLESAALEFRLVTSPTHGTLHGTPPQLTYEPAAGWSGEDSLTFVARDGEADSAPARVVLQVRPVNDAPQITSTPSVAVEAGTPWNYPATATDADSGDTLTWSLPQAPTGMTIDAASGQIGWTPTADQVGTHPIQVRVTDAAGASDTQAFTLEISRANAAPQILSPAVVLATEGEAFRYSVHAEDPDGDVLGYALEQAPAGAIVGTTNGVIEWTAPASASRGITTSNPYCRVPLAGSSTASVDFVTVVDRSASMHTEHDWIPSMLPGMELNLRKSGVGTAGDNRYGLADFINTFRPYVLNDGVWGDFRAAAQASYQLSLDGSATQEDGYLAIHATLAAYDFRPAAARNMVLITDEGRSIVDGRLNFENVLAELLAERVMLNAVLDVRLRCGNGDEALGMNSQGQGFVADGSGGWKRCAGAQAVSGNENTTSAYVPLALRTGGAVWDLDMLRKGGLVSRSMAQAFIDAKVTEITGQVEYAPRADLMPEAIRLIEATDGNPARVEVDVLNRGLAAAAGTLSLALADGTALSPVGELAIESLAVGASRAFHFPLGAPLAGTKALQATVRTTSGVDCVAANDALSAPLFRVRAADPAGLSDNQDFAVTVAERNEPPVFDGPLTLQALTGRELRTTLRGTDPDRGDAFAWRLLEGPAGLRLDEQTGELRFLPASGQNGTHVVRIALTDLGGLSSEASLAVRVSDAVTPPTLTSTPDARAVTGTTWVYVPQAQNSSGTTWSLFTAPSGMTIDPQTGALAWPVPATSVPGDETVVLLVVTGPDGGYDYQVFDLFVDRPNVAPRITSTPVLEVAARSTYTYQATLEDPNLREQHAWTLLHAPGGLGIAATEPNRARLEWLYTNVGSSAPETQARQHPFCRTPAAVGVSLAQQNAWELSTTLGTGFGAPVAARLFDTDADGDVDADDAPALAVVGSLAVAGGSKNGMAVVDAKSGAVRWRFTERALLPGSAPVAADLNGDGIDELVAFGTDKRLVAIDAAGRYLWSSVQLGFEWLKDTTLAAADLDGDGKDELLHGGTVFKSNGDVLWSFEYSGVQAYYATILVADVQGDARPELLFGDQVRDTGGTLLRKMPMPWASHVNWAVGNLDGDAAPESAALAQTNSGTHLYVFDHDGTQLFVDTSLSHTGQLTIADFNGDGRGEVFTTKPDRFYAADGSFVASASEPPHAGDAVFAADLDADGALELVRTSNFGVLVQGGATGATISDLGQVGSLSSYAHGGVLVDVEGEGWLFAAGSNSLRAWRAGYGRWAAPTELPTQQQSRVARGTLPAGTFGVVTRRGQGATLLPDLWVGNLTLARDAGGYVLEAEVRNRGLGASAPYGLRLSSGGTPLQDLSGDVLAAGRSRVMRWTIAEVTALRDEIVAEIDPRSAAQCETRNDRNAARYVALQVADHGPLTDTQRWLLQVQQSNRPPALTSWPASLQAQELSEWSYDAVASDQDIGDSLRYSLGTAPAGARIEQASGHVRWIPARGDAGKSFRFTVLVHDLEGSATQQDFEVTVSPAPNTAPQFTSTPIETARVGRAYSYAARATDAEGDALTYSVEGAPQGIAIDAQTGVLSGAAASAGDYAVTLRASDAHGGTGTQTFTLHVAPDGGPTISSTPPRFARTGAAYAYVAQASDPENDPLTYRVLDPIPQGLAHDAGRIAWTPRADQLGAHELTLEVSDGRNTTRQTWTVQVAAPDALPQVQIWIDPAAPTPGQPIAIHVASELPLPVTVSLDGTPVTLAPSGPTTIPPPANGPHTLVAVQDTPQGPVVTSINFDVEDAVDVAPRVSLIAPAEHPDYDAIEVTAPITVRGSILDSDLVRWSLGFQDRNGGPIVELASGTQAFTERDLAPFDPTRLLNGQYQLVLQGWDAEGHHGFDARVLRVTGDLKLGHYAITFEDVSVPVAGIPVTVTRTYDTRRRLESLDFGHGWTVDASNVRVHESRRIGFGWQEHRIDLGQLDDFCILPNGDPIVTVTLPDGQVESFKAKVQPECDKAPRNEVTLVFEPIDGTDSKLESSSQGNLRFTGSNLTDLSDPDYRSIDPTGYTLTTAEGLVYEIDQNVGLKKVTEPNGKFLTYDRDGVRHSGGLAVEFVRNAAGRITQLKLPDGKTIDYTYDAAGDLRSIRDAALDEARFGYHPQYAHYLESVEDARRIVVSRNEYDAQGKLIATIDADGKRIEYAHDVAARTSRVKDRRGNPTTYAYDDNGRVTVETNALGETIRHSYDEDGNELTRTDALNRVTTWTYDSRGNVLTERNHAGEITTSSYNPQNQLLTQRDAANRFVLENVYIDHGLNLYSTQDALGNQTTFRYDVGVGSTGTGQVDAIHDAAGGATSFTYNVDDGFRLSETDALNNRTDFVADEMGRTKEERRKRTRADGTVETLTTQYAYDGKGRVTAVTQPDGSVTTTEYAGLDQPAKECDALQRCTEHVYNARGEEIETRHADGTTETKAYDENGNLLAQTDRLGRTTKFVYDAANRLVETIHPDATPTDDADNPRSKSVYDAAGQLRQSIDENGQVTTYGYDAAGRRIRTLLTPVAGQSAVIVDTYDVAGRRTQSTDADGHVTQYVYDAAGRLVETIHDDATADPSDNPRTRVEYDALGRKIAETDEQQRTTRYAYDTLGRLVAVVLPNPVTGANPALVEGASPDSGTLTTRYTYDEAGNKLTQTDAEGRTTRWEYDSVGRETARILPEGQRETKQYNAAGELIAHTDFLGRTTRYSYDTAGRARTLDYPTDPDVSFGYDANGARTTAVDARGTSTTAYDERGRLVKVLDADGGQLEYHYDAAGNLIARISASQSLVYTYDARNRLQSVVRSVDGEAPITTRYEYDRDGNRTAMLGGDGIRTSYTYDRRHRLVNLTKTKADGSLMVAMDYTVDASGMRTGVVERDPAGTTRQVAWSYDPVRRLVREAIDHREAQHDRTQSWTYDDVGNRLTQTLVTSDAAGAPSTETTTYAYDRNDRLLSETKTGGAHAGSTTYNYDANGNTTRKAGPQGTIEYRYDDANRLVGATTSEGVVEYVYNADGLRVRQTFTPNGGVPTTTWYVQDTAYAYAQVVEEYTSSNGGAKTLAATFTFADELVSQTRYASGTPTTRYIQSDGFGSTRWLTDAAGAITDKVDYDAFGAKTGRTGTTSVEHLYRGERFDADLAVYDLRARLYEPGNGRFLTQDTFAGFSSDPRSLHRYQFNHADPVNRLDPSGHMSLLELSAATGVLGSLLASSTPSISSVVGAGGCPTGTYTNPTDRLCIHGTAAFKSIVDQVESHAVAAGIRVFDDIRRLGRKLTHVRRGSRDTIGPDKHGNMIVDWNPSQGALVITRRHYAAYQSPALGLVHELGHAAQVVLQGLSAMSELPELPVIQGVEEQWVSYYGEPRRLPASKDGGEAKDGMKLFEFSRTEFRSR